MARMDDLQALRQSVQQTHDACDSVRDRIAAARLLRDLIHDVADAEKAEPKPKGTPLDELQDRRSRRATGTAGR